VHVATDRQRRAAKRNIKKAQKASKQKKTLAKLPKSTRQDLGRQAAKARQRKRGELSGHQLENRSRQELYELAKKKNIAGRSRMGKWDLIQALRRGR
jgi:hypothetical protein